MSVKSLYGGARFQKCELRSSHKAHTTRAKLSKYCGIHFWEKKMNKIAVAFAGLLLASTLSHAGETLDAAAVKALITDKTVTGIRTKDGATLRNYFSPDGKVYRLEDGQVAEGTWQVNDDGTQCVEGIAGGCAKIVSNGDGTYDRNHAKSGKTLLKWNGFANGRNF